MGVFEVLRPNTEESTCSLESPNLTSEEFQSNSEVYSDSDYASNATIGPKLYNQEVVSYCQASDSKETNLFYTTKAMYSFTQAIYSFTQAMYSITQAMYSFTQAMYPSTSVAPSLMVTYLEY